VRILLVEDNERVTEVVTSALRSSGHGIQVAGTCAQALARLGEERYDLAIIDLGLPDGSGLDVCRRAREGGHDMPILILTARNGVHDRVSGLDAGADDYLGKPFATAELTARVRALGRRGPRWTESVRAFGPVVIDRDRRTATLGGEWVALTPREFDIVALLAWADGRVVARDHLLESVWGDTNERASASLEVLITRIRRKLARAAKGEVIRTVRQVGYAWALDRSKNS
jgi:two-component system, OmpR family, response regulator